MTADVRKPFASGSSFGAKDGSYIRRDASDDKVVLHSGHPSDYGHGQLQDGVDDARKKHHMPTKAIQQLLAEQTAEWMAIPGVVGTAIGEFEGQPCIKIFLAEKTDELAASFPSTLEGHRVVLDETGDFRAL